MYYVWAEEAMGWKIKESLNILKYPSLESVEGKLQEASVIRNITSTLSYNEKEPNSFLV